MATSSTLYSTTTTTTTTTTTQASFHPPSSSIPPSRLRLVIRQQPIRARMIGFGDGDRRPIDPPPILQLFDDDPLYAQTDIKQRFSKLTSLLVFATLIQEAKGSTSAMMAEQQPTSTDRQSGHSISPSPLFNPTSPATVSTSAGRDLLVGGVCAEVNLMYDINGERGLFFAFPDLSIRVSGRFRIRFTLFDLKATCPFSLAHAVIVSDCFSVFHPKDFPGMASSTDLSRCLARQGLRIHIRSSQSEHLDGGVGDKGKKRKDVVQDAGSAKKRGRTVKEARDVVGREVQNEGAAGEGDDDGDVVPVIPARALA